jgi:hypothetical protein
MNPYSVMLAMLLGRDDQMKRRRRDRETKIQEMLDLLREPEEEPESFQLQARVPVSWGQLKHYYKTGDPAMWE